MNVARDEVDRTGGLDAIREAYEQLPVSVGTVRGRDYVFVAANAAYRAFSADRAILGLPAREVFAEALGQQVFEILDRAFATGQIQSGREWRIQLDRGEGMVDIFLDFTISPVVSASGEVSGLNILITEVTEQVHARQATLQQATLQQAAEAERRYQAVRDVVAELQEALLPSALPVLPQVTVAARYLVAEHDLAAGGDWFDAVPLPDGRLALVVGDIVGHGVAASAAMGQLRAVLNELLTETGDLEQAMSRADRMASRSPVMRAATICAAVS